MTLLSPARHLNWFPKRWRAAPHKRVPTPIRSSLDGRPGPRNAQVFGKGSAYEPREIGKAGLVISFRSAYSVGFGVTTNISRASGEADRRGTIPRTTQ
jgi:hypothetical protein